MSEEVTRIHVDGQAVGIIGLKQVFEQMADDFIGEPDDQVKRELLTRLSKKNYIPDGVREAYGTAFLQEFKKHTGQPYDRTDAPEGLEVKVLGQGCSQCDRLTRDLMDLIAELNLRADLEHVTDIKEIAKYRVMGAPALLINGKVVSVGKVPSKRELKNWLENAAR